MLRFGLLVLLNLWEIPHRLLVQLANKLIENFHFLLKRLIPMGYFPLPLRDDLRTHFDTLHKGGQRFPIQLFNRGVLLHKPEKLVVVLLNPLRLYRQLQLRNQFL